MNTPVCLRIRLNGHGNTMRLYSAECATICVSKNCNGSARNYTAYNYQRDSALFCVLPWLLSISNIGTSACISGRCPRSNWSWLYARSRAPTPTATHSIHDSFFTFHAETRPACVVSVFFRGFRGYYNGLPALRPRQGCRVTPASFSGRRRACAPAACPSRCACRRWHRRSAVPAGASPARWWSRAAGSGSSHPVP